MTDAVSSNPTGEVNQSPGRILQDKATQLQQELEAGIQHARAKKRSSQLRASVIKLAIIFFSGLATVLLGLQIPSVEGTLKQIAFALGAIVTMLNAVEPFFNYRALWVEHESALAGFYRIRRDLVYYLRGLPTDQLDGKVLKKFHDQYQAVWDQLSTAWIGYRRAKDPEKQLEV
jgi:hypothetical protein